MMSTPIQEPSIVRLTCIEIGVNPVRGQQKVFAEGVEASVQIELPTAITSLGSGRKYLNDYVGIEQRVSLVVEKARFSAKGRNVRVCIQAAGSDPHTHIAGMHATWSCPELLVQRGVYVDGDQVVPFARSRHREHLTVEIFALKFRLALDFEVLFLSQERLRQRRHDSVLVDNVTNLRPRPGAAVRV